MKKFLIIALGFHLTFFPVSIGQIVKGIRLSSTIGFNHYSATSTSEAEHPDMMNYYMYLEDIYLNIALYAELKNNWTVGLSTDIGSELKPVNFSAKIYQMPFRYLGFLAGYKYDRYYVNGIDSYRKEKDTEYYILNSNFVQSKLNSHDIFAGAFIPLAYGRLNTRLEVSGGYNLNSETNFVWLEKQKNTNEMRMFEYNVVPNSSWFFNPNLEVGFDVFKSQKITFGLLGNVNFHFEKKSIDYERTFYEWTYDNPEVRKITGTTHSVRHLKWDVGVYFKF
ncbi:MAG: hypothetical protein ACK5KP_08435 [Paludibacteraceae bacterium]